MPLQESDIEQVHEVVQIAPQILIEEDIVPAAKVEIHRSYGSVWKAGDLIAGYDDLWGTYSILLCVEAREVGPRGGIRKPARTAEITGRSWNDVLDAVEELGFERPEVRP